jgi:cytochrome c peroxidase
VKLEQIAAYEKTVFSSPSVAAVFDAVSHGQPAPDPDPVFAPGSDEAAGKALFQIACVGCHGGASGDAITNRAAADQTFVALNPDGSVQTVVLPDGSIGGVPLTGHDNGNFLNIGISAGGYLRQIPPELGGIFDPTALPLPHYRLRFYTDATRTQQVVDLPPPPPLLGPGFFPQLFTVDPGRAVISGDPADFEAFDIPQLRGIAHTAPYFHDNSRLTLLAVVNLYSRFILPGLDALGLPAVVPSAGPGLPPESLTATQKAQLVAYLNTI